RVQRLDASGLVATGWPATGAIAAEPTRSPGATHLVADGTGGACLAWLDVHEASGGPIRGVRLSRGLADGMMRDGGGPGGGGAGEGADLALDSPSLLVADGTGGCYLAWATVFSAFGDAYAQHLSAEGSVFTGWPDGGLPLASFVHSNCVDSPYAISDGS